MEFFSKFVKDNYLIFTVISLILILALIGYLVETRSSRDIKIKKKKNAADVPAEEIDSI